MAMTFLDLINSAMVECGVSGAQLSTAQALTGEAARMKGWINQAYMDIQNTKEDWFFMRRSAQFNTTAQKQFYTSTEAGITSFSSWKVDSFRVSTSGSNFADEQLVNYMDYGTFRNLYMYGSQRTTYTRPVVITVAPDKSIGFGSIPDTAYVAAGEYYMDSSLLVNDTDVPIIPSRFHMVIVYRAMMYYGGFESANEVFSRGQAEYNKLFGKLSVDQMQTIISGAPLA